MKLRQYLAKLCLLAVFLIPISAFSINGSFDFGFSEITRGMGGAGSAFPQDAVIAAVNPAGMVDVGHRYDVGAVFYFPDMYYQASAGVVPPPTIVPTPVGPIVIPNSTNLITIAPGRHDSNKSVFFLPDFGANWMIDKNSSVGFTLFSQGGYGSEYSPAGTAQVSPFGVPAPGPFGGGGLESDLKQAIASLTYAHKFWRHSSVGISLLIAAQTLMVNGARQLAMVSNNPGSLTNRGHDFSGGIGTRLGIILGFIPHIDIALSYQPEVFMSRLSKYSGLLPDQGKFDIPPAGVIGFAFHLNPRVTLAFDIQEIWYSAIPAYSRGNASVLFGGTCMPGVAGPTCYGGANGPGFGWKNSTAYKLGLQWQCMPSLALRIGYNHSATVLRPNQAGENVIAPGAAIENIVTVGASKRFNKKGQINVVFAYVPKHTFRGVNSFSGIGQTVAIHAEGFGLGVSYSWLFL